jgi:hypothetical protein
MKKMTDEEIQSLLEEGAALPLNNTDTYPYEVLFTALKQEPPGGLPLSFSSNVVRKIRAARNRKSDLLVYVIISILLLAGLTAAFFCLLFMDKETAGVVASSLTAQPGIWIFAAVIITLTIFSHRKKIPAG